jgi:hypothetical protein
MRVQSEVSNVNNKAILLDESHILDPWLLDEGPRPKSGKSRLNLTWKPPFGSRKSIGSHPKKRKEKKRAGKRAHDLGNHDAS